MDLPALTSAAVVTISDGVDAGTREDRSGRVLVEMLTGAGFTVDQRLVVPDEIIRIVPELRRLVGSVALVITTGGTGFGPRDVTPEATSEVIERRAPGLQTLMITKGLEATPMAALSRGIVGSAGPTLIVNLPGSPRGAAENLEAVLGVVPHALQLLAGDTEHGSGAG